MSRGAYEQPGPIFLRHIVTRRFKYRWLTLAITTCRREIAPEFATEFQSE